MTILKYIYASIVLILLFGLINNCFAQHILYKISGTVFNSALGINKGEAYAIVTLLVSDSLHYETKTDLDGHYKFEKLELQPNNTYTLEAHQIGSLSVYEKLQIKENHPTNEFQVDFTIYITHCWKLIVLSEYLPEKMFSKLSYKPKTTLKKGLKEIANKMSDNPTIVILISGHSDYDEATYSDTILSYNRAMAAKRVLIQNGIADDRVLIEGVGMAKPFTILQDILELKKGMIINEKQIESLNSQQSIELAHQLNRRISIDISRTDYIPKE